MKSKDPPKGHGGASSGDPEKDLTQEQLAKLGALAIAFNYAEIGLERCLFYSLNLYGNLGVDIVKRIGQIEKKAELYKLSMAYCERIITMGYGLKDLKFKEPFISTLAAFNAVRTYRDLVIHSIVYNAQPTIGKRFGYSGEAGAAHVVMDIDALTRYYGEIQSVRKEFEQIERCLSLIRPLVVAYNEAGRPKLELSSEAQECLRKVQDLQKERSRLGPYPKFPDKL